MLIQPIEVFIRHLFKHIRFQQLFDGAAVLSFYFFLSLFPLLFVLLSLAKLFTFDQLGAENLSWWQNQFPPEVSSLITSSLQKSSKPISGGFLFGLVFMALFLASNGLAAVIRQLNVAYKVQTQRGFFKLRLRSILLTLGFGVLTTIPFLIDIQFKLAGQKYILFAGFLFLALIAIYYLGPNTSTKFRYSIPGAFFGAVGLSLSTQMFEYYIQNFGNYGLFYGSLGTVIISLLWLYILGLLIILGGYINHSIRVTLGYAEE